MGADHPDGSDRIQRPAYPGGERLIMMGKTDVPSARNKDQETEIPAFFQQTQGSGIIDADLFIGRMQLDAANPGSCHAFQLGFPSVEGGMHGCKGKQSVRKDGLLFFHLRSDSNPHNNTIAPRR